MFVKKKVSQIPEILEDNILRISQIINRWNSILQTTAAVKAFYEEACNLNMDTSLPVFPVSKAVKDLLPATHRGKERNSLRKKMEKCIYSEQAYTRETTDMERKKNYRTILNLSLHGLIVDLNSYCDSFIPKLKDLQRQLVILKNKQKVKTSNLTYKPFSALKKYNT